MVKDDHGFDQETVLLIAESARETLEELYVDYRRLKDLVQQNLTISAVLLGLLLTISEKAILNPWGSTKAYLLIGATILLMAGTIGSLILLLSFQFETGYISPKTLLDNYVRKSPIELYQVQLAKRIEAINDVNSKNNRVGMWGNGMRILTVLASICIGAAFLMTLFSTLIKN